VQVLRAVSCRQETEKLWRTAWASSENFREVVCVRCQRRRVYGERAIGIGDGVVGCGEGAADRIAESDRIRAARHARGHEGAGICLGDAATVQKQDNLCVSHA
jgi:hypothetical protein